MFKRFLFFSVIILLVWKTDGAAGNQDGFAGIVTRVKGVVTARKAGNETALPLKVGDHITVGQIVVSSGNSGVQIVFSDDSFVNVLPVTTLFITQYNYSKDTGRRTAVIKIINGRVRLVLYKVRSSESRFVVETEHATVTVGICDFFVNVSRSVTEILNLGAPFSVKNVSPLVVGVVSLGPNQKTVLKEMKPPEQPVTVSPEQRRMYLKDAEI